MSIRLAFFVGSSNSFNVQQTVKAIGNTLGGEFQLHLISTSRLITEEANNHYEIFGIENPKTVRGEYKALEAYLNSKEPACLVNVTQPPIHGNIVGFLAKKHNVPFIYRYSGDRFNVYNQASNLRQKIKWFLLNNVGGTPPLWLASKYIALGPIGKTRLTTRGVSEANISILPPPIIPDRFEKPVKKPNIEVPNSRRVVLQVGRRSRLKGIDTLEAAIPKILDRRTDLQFVFIGKGRDINVPKSVSDYITVVGPVPPRLIPRYFHRADLLVHPSLTESFGRVLVEALFCETPVIARSAGEMPTVTDNLFSTIEELVNLVVHFESLPLDDPLRYTPQSLRPAYIDFFDQFN